MFADTAALAQLQTRLLGFDLDPTTLPTDILCHLALELFVSAGLPTGLGEDRVRRFILAVRAPPPLSLLSDTAIYEP